MSVLVFEGFLSTPEMLQVFDKTAVVQAMMDFEAGLARAQGRVGLIPPAAAQAIASLCRAELYDVAALVEASGRAGSLAIPVVQKLAETVALFDPTAAGFVHWGSTSQDVIDTAMVLQTRRALRLIEEDLLALVGSLLDLADQYPATPLLAQAEIGELAEPVAPGRGGSSAMPHKRNPVACMQALAAAQRAPQRVAALLACMTQEHERGLGGWQAELAEWADLLLHAHGSVRAMAGAVAGLQVFPARMLCNIDGQRDLVFAEGLAQLLAPLLGKQAAHQQVEALCARVAAGEAPLRLLARQLLQQEPRLNAAALEAQFDVHRVAGHADARVAGVLAGARGQWTALVDNPHW